MTTPTIVNKRCTRRALALIASITMTAGSNVHAASGQERDPYLLAQSSGCMLCHDMQMPKAVGAQVPPVGPTWRDISQKYKGRPDAVRDLTRIILKGSGGQNTDRHWAGRASGVEMPANAIEISENDAQVLAAWIVSLADSR